MQLAEQMLLPHGEVIYQYRVYREGGGQLPRRRDHPWFKFLTSACLVPCPVLMTLFRLNLTVHISAQVMIIYTLAEDKRPGDSSWYTVYVYRSVTLSKI